MAKKLAELKTSDEYIAALEEYIETVTDWFIAWASITVCIAHMEHDDPCDDAWHSDDWRGELASGHYDIWEKLPEHIKKAIEREILCH